MGSLNNNFQRHGKVLLYFSLLLSGGLACKSTASRVSAWTPEQADRVAARFVEPFCPDPAADFNPLQELLGQEYREDFENIDYQTFIDAVDATPRVNCPPDPEGEQAPLVAPNTLPQHLGADRTGSDSLNLALPSQQLSPGSVRRLTTQGKRLIGVFRRGGKPPVRTVIKIKNTVRASKLAQDVERRFGNIAINKLNDEQIVALVKGKKTTIRIPGYARPISVEYSIEDDAIIILDKAFTTDRGDQALGFARILMRPFNEKFRPNVVDELVDLKRNVGNKDSFSLALDNDFHVNWNRETDREIFGKMDALGGRIAIMLNNKGLVGKRRFFNILVERAKLDFL